MKIIEFIRESRKSKKINIPFVSNENHESHRNPLEKHEIMKIIEFHKRIKIFMKILEFQQRILKIIKIKESHKGNYENHENLGIPTENQ